MPPAWIEFSVTRMVARGVDGFVRVALGEAKY